MRVNNLNNQQGFIALISAIIISLLLVTISVTVATTGFLSRFNVLDSENKERSLALAEACLDTALLRLALNPADTTTGPVVISGSDTCNVYSVALNTPVADQITIQAKGVTNKAVTNLELIVNKDGLTQISWEEIPSL